MLPGQSDLPLPYNLSLVEGDKISYSFTTDAGIKYLVNFVPSNEGYNYGDIGDSTIYEYQLILMSNEVGGHDKRVLSTVVHSICHLLETIKNIVLYICDSSDGRQEVRSKLFHHWFEKYKTESVYKIDGKIPSEDDVNKFEFISIILNSENPHALKVEEVFSKILDTETKN